MFSFLLFSVKRAWQGFWRNAAMSLAATATMMLMLLLLASFWIVQAGFLASLSYVEDKVGVVADINDGVTTAQIQDVKERLTEMPEVKSIEYVSKDQALARYREERAAQGQQDYAAHSRERGRAGELRVFHVAHAALFDRCVTWPRDGRQ